MFLFTHPRKYTHIHLCEYNPHLHIFITYIYMYISYAHRILIIKAIYPYSKKLTLCITEYTYTVNDRYVGETYESAAMNHFHIWTCIHTHTPVW